MVWTSAYRTRGLTLVNKHHYSFRYIEPLPIRNNLGENYVYFCYSS